MGYLLGLDIGSSSIKASLVDSATGALKTSASSPATELPIHAEKPGWAEQDPSLWWEHVGKACALINDKDNSLLKSVSAVGISYQMHGLVVVDKNHKPLRPSIIWCDSRAVPIGDKAFKELGPEKCLTHLLNSPGNFTAGKLKWVKENEPEIYKKIHKAMLPGDYIAMMLGGPIVTTPSGLSEGIFWDFKADAPAKFLIDHYGFSPEMLPEIKPTFSEQGRVDAKAATYLGIPCGIPISYRAGDQPNNAFSLSVLEPGEIAATAGTSGVVYGVGDKASYDTHSRVNTFVHVNHSSKTPRYGTLLCCNGTGILNSWIKREFGEGASYDEMNMRAAGVSPGAQGLRIYPYGNGAERSLGNKEVHASLQGINFNIHNKDHLFRGAQEGIVYSLNFGLEIMREMGIPVKKVRAGHANLFLSPLFREVFATVTGATVELCNTDGAQGAARGAGIGAGFFKSAKEAFSSLKIEGQIEPRKEIVNVYKDLYGEWREGLSAQLASR